MLCIIAFIIFLALFPVGMFFPLYRKWFNKSLHCISKRATFKPCDVDFSGELKNEVVSAFAYRSPKFAKFLLKTMDLWLWTIAILSIWSLWSVFHSGINLWVYDTCDPFSEEGCSLSGDSCNIGVTRTPIWDTKTYLIEQRDYYKETFSRIPDKFRKWEPRDYSVDSSTYTGNTESDKLILEIMDPSCVFCKNQWLNLKESEAYSNAKITYLLYPIPYGNIGYRYENSYYLASVIESLKSIDGMDIKFLDIYFSSYQDDFLKTPLSDLSLKIDKLLEEELDLSREEIKFIQKLVDSKEVKESLAKQSDLVKNKIKTKKIPTVFINSQRFDRVIDAYKINRALE